MGVDGPRSKTVAEPFCSIHATCGFPGCTQKPHGIWYDTKETSPTLVIINEWFYAPRDSLISKNNHTQYNGAMTTPTIYIYIICWHSIHWTHRDQTDIKLSSNSSSKQAYPLTNWALVWLAANCNCYGKEREALSYPRLAAAQCEWTFACCAWNETRRQFLSRGSLLVIKR